VMGREIATEVVEPILAWLRAHPIQQRVEAGDDVDTAASKPLPVSEPSPEDAAAEDAALHALPGLALNLVKAIKAKRPPVEQKKTPARKTAAKKAAVVRKPAAKKAVVAKKPAAKKKAAARKKA